MDLADWAYLGACAGKNPEWWFPTSPLDVFRAVDICNVCDVKRECFAYAVESKQQYGIWGGIIFTYKKAQTLF